MSFVRRELVGGLGRVHLPHPEIFQAVEAGHTLLLDDGKFKLRVVEASDVRIDAEVMTSGVLGSRKGISLPDTVLPFGAMTEKDRADVELRAVARRGLDRSVLRAAGRGHRRGAQAGPRPRLP